MNMELKIDYSEFNRALALYAAATGKDAPDVVNRARDNILIKSRYSLVKLTPKATAKEIEEDLRKGNMLAKIVTKRLGKGHTKSERRREMRRQMGRRKKSGGYIVSGWIAASRKAGIPTQAQAGKLKLSNGSSTTATESNPLSVIENMTKGAGEVGANALQASVNLAAADMKDYAMKKLAKRSQQFSAR